MGDPAQPVRDAVQARLAVVDAELAALAARSASLSRARGFLFLACAALGVFGGVKGLPTAGWAGLSAGVALFLALVVKHALVASDELRAAERRRVLQGSITRLDGGLEEDAEGGSRFRPAGHAFAEDLDLFGDKSLFRTMCRARTSFGQATLAGWLLAPADAPTVAARQAAVRELAEDPRFLEELAVRAIRADAGGREVEPLVGWAGGAAQVPGTKGLFVALGRVLVPLTLLAFVGSRFLKASHPLLASLWVVPLVAQSVCLVALYGTVAKMVQQVSSREQPFGRYRALFELVEGTQFTAPALATHAEALRRGGGDGPASAEVAALERIVSFADLRHNSVIHFLANTLLLWDLWCALALERWRARCGRHVAAWLTALGDVEALASLATLARENPSWVLPEVVEGPPRLEVEGLGHPLLRPDARVANDVALVATEVGERPYPGQALLVTGSNMSGKSTYLRSVGLCAVMALAGAPVCAKRAKLTPLRTWTSMRIRDDLADGVSHFYAELRRLKEVVDATRERADVLFLLDEILHGTNSRERIVGARHVVAKLVEKGAIGAVSSHDLGLSDLEERCDGQVRNVHFRETVEGDVMSFDYRLREGVVDTSNALRLMRGVGLDVPLT